MLAKKGYLWTHNSIMDLKLMQNEVNATLNPRRHFEFSIGG